MTPIENSKSAQKQGPLIVALKVSLEVTLKSVKLDITYVIWYIQSVLNPKTW